MMVLGHQRHSDFSNDILQSTAMAEYEVLQNFHEIIIMNQKS